MLDLVWHCISRYYSYLYLNYALDPHRLFAQDCLFDRCIHLSGGAEVDTSIVATYLMLATENEGLVLWHRPLFFFR